MDCILVQKKESYVKSKEIKEKKKVRIRRGVNPITWDRASFHSCTHQAITENLPRARICANIECNQGEEVPDKNSDLSTTGDNLRTQHMSSA